MWPLISGKERFARLYRFAGPRRPGTMLQDLKVAARGCAKSPAFAVTAALGPEAALRARPSRDLPMIFVALDVALPHEGHSSAWPLA
jgi:hypothetical protein